MTQRLSTTTDADREEHLTDGTFRDGLELIAEGVTDMVGFNLACISVVRTAPDGSQDLEVLALGGSDYSAEMVVGRRTPLAGLLGELAKAEDWGRFRFLPHELLDTEDVENAYGWVVPDLVPGEGPNAWHPLDLLVALLHDDHGNLRGSLAIDLPENGLRPDAEQRRLLEKFAVQAERAVVTHLEREELAEQVRLAETARTIVRSASAQDGLSAVLQQCQAGLVEGFRCHGSWIQTFDEDGRGSGAIHTSSSSQVVLPVELIGVATSAAQTCWSEQRTVVIAPGHPVPSVLSDAEQHAVLAFMDDIRITSLLFVPLGAGGECLGNLVLTRTDDRDWTDLDRQAALDIGHDLGRVVLNARTFEREHELVLELRALDSYKSQLIATVSHELKNPLAAVAGYAEVLESAPELAARSRSAVDAIVRGAGRLNRVIDDLLVLSKVEDPHRPLEPVPVDLSRLVADTLELLDVTITQGQVDVVTNTPEGGVLADGDRDELACLVTNLISNAVKYTDLGKVVVTVERHGSVTVLQVSDEGLGISADDQARLFTEFFRSSNPVATSRPGTGLGLAIVKRIVDRHGGTITVDSELGRGSTFTVTLPAAG
ncbi:sensor histidine kinase [Nocardioides coralli]|uniref:sensor histidine kinase n=1 Tax=Nocardioides coralli TaxID=2872154 RepID=UPI001CA45FEB|nr:HAMP domain-containing sensor histidine kinase [Nocardioides coralli]QZY28843.1 HAMP domain-containing histidine kinase [Nocardioides coralli]